MRNLFGMNRTDEPEFDPGFPVDPEYYERTGASRRTSERGREEPHNQGVTRVR